MAISPIGSTQNVNTRERPPFAYGRLGRTSDKLSIQLATPTSL